MMKHYIITYRRDDGEEDIVEVNAYSEKQARLVAEEIVGKDYVLFMEYAGKR